MKIEHLWQAIFAIIGALASAYGGYWVGNQPERVGTLEFRIDTDEGLKRFFGSSGDVRLLYKGVEQTDISRVNVRIANTSKRNTEKVRIYLQVKDKSRPAIIADFDVPEGYPRDVVKSLPPVDGVYSFEVDYMNRAPEFWDAFRFTLYFSGEKPPEVDVRVAAKGLTLKKYDFGNVDTIDIIARVIGAMWWFLLLYAGGIYLFVRYSRVARDLRIANTKSTLTGLLSSPAPSDSERDAFLNKATKDALSSPKFTAVVRTFFGKGEA
jgi:hypothetical protein